MATMARRSELVSLTTNATERHYLKHMSNLAPRSKGFTTAAIVLLLPGIGPSADGARYNPVARQVVEARLRRVGGDDGQREATLSKMFAEAGCDDQHVSAQAVKGSRLPNVICLLPGSSTKVIIVGAHFDRVSEGDGVVDNWSGRSLLPSLVRSGKE